MNHSLLLHALQRLLPIVLMLAHPGLVSAQAIEQKLTASNGEMGDEFGHSVSLWGDYAIVGAYRDNELGDNSGSASVFERQIGGSWIEVANLNASDEEEGDRFGWSVSISDEFALVGAYRDDVQRGAAYVFQRHVDGSWVEEAKLIASDREEFDTFGISVSISGSRALVGAQGDDDLGDQSGSAYMFEQQLDGSWVEVAKLHASDGSAVDLFGTSVSLSRDRAIIGAPKNDGPSINSHDRGSAYVFERQPDESWAEVAKLFDPDGRRFDFFGISASIWEGRRIFICANHGGNEELGSAFVYELQEDGSWAEVSKLTTSDHNNNDSFCRSVSVFRNNAVVGAWRDAGGGSAYLFERRRGGVWIEVGKLTASDGTDGDNFGYSVSLFQDVAIVGSPKDDDRGTDSGSAYVFENLFPVANEQTIESPESHYLSNTYPNPFKPHTRFSLNISEPQHVRIEVVNTLGQTVDVLHDGQLSGLATHPFAFEAVALPSGIYLLRVIGEAFTATRTMTLLK